VFSVLSVANAFFNQNAHLRPIIGRLYIPMLYEVKKMLSEIKKSACPVRCVFHYLTGVKIRVNPWLILTLTNYGTKT